MPLTPSMIITTTHDLIWYSIVMAALSLRFTVVVLFSCISFTCAQDDCDVPSCLSLCPMGQYYTNDTSLNDTDCCQSCNSSRSEVEEGSGTDCQSCDESCVTCFGSSSGQCYTCEGPYIVLVRGGEDSVICDNGLLRNTSLDIVQCLANCSIGASINMDTMQCTCDRGYYQNMSECVECVSNCTQCINATQQGCLMCNGVYYQGYCRSSCPVGTIEMEGQCMSGNTRFNLSITYIIAIIAGVSGIILIAFILIVVILCCCICKARMNRGKYASDSGTHGAPVVISESFKHISIKRDKLKKKDERLDSANSVYLHNLRHSYDPYYSGAAVSGKDETKLDTLLPQEGSYVQMTPATSQEQLHKDGSKSDLLPLAHKKVGPSLSFQEHTAPPTQPSRNSLQPVGSYGEHYEEMNAFTAFASPYALSSQQDEESEDEEQRMYEDLSGNYQPTIPPREIISPKVNDDRRDTLDNQYIEVNRDNKGKLNRGLLSSGRLLEEPQYINVARGGDHRIRAATTPQGVSSNEEEESEYQNVSYQSVEEEEELYY